MTEILPVRLAIVGCGAMSEIGHLPALTATTALVPTILIDPDEDRARSLALKFGVPRFSINLADATEHAEAACVVVPHHVHVSVACQLISYGLHILIEKPLATTLADCDRIIACAREREVVLAVAMVRRFARTTRFLKEIMDQRTFGKVRSFRLVSGTGGVWPTKSTYLLSGEHSGGGVIMSNGVHDIDLVTWLFGKPILLECHADADFGKNQRLESDVVVRMKTDSAISGEVELSRTRDLQNGLWIEMERASIYSPLFGDEVRVTLPGGSPVNVLGRLIDEGEPGRLTQSFNDMLTDQLNDFAAAVRGLRVPMVDGLTGRQTIETVALCYANVLPLDLPWRQSVFVPEPVSA